MGRRLKTFLLPDGRPMVRNLPIHSWEIRLEMIDMALILIVGDEPDACRMLQRILLSFGHSVQAFTESEKAIRWLEDNVPDLTLVDIDSRGSDSIGVLEAIQNRRADNKAVMITGNLSAETARRAMELGIQDYLVKPVEIDELEEWVGKALGLIL
jgi:DNA-binding NtrC family response regulator